VQEQRRQHQPCDEIGPVEEVVEPVVASAGGESKDTEERDSEPEEMQRRLIVRPAEPDRRADNNGQDPDKCERVVQRLVNDGRGLELQGDREFRRRALYDVDVRIAFASILQQPAHVVDGGDLPPIDGQKHIARQDTGAGAGSRGCHFQCHDVDGLLPPQHTVFNFAFPCLDDGDVDDRKRDQNGRHRDGQRYPHERTQTTGHGWRQHRKHPLRSPIRSASAVRT
jgi:hypothetical protein